MPILTLDIGGTKTICAEAKKTARGWSIQNVTQEPTTHAGRKAIVSQILKLVRQHTAKPHSVHIAFAAGVYPDNRIINAPNISTQLSDFNLITVLQDKLHCPITLINDVQAFTLAEAIYGAGKNHETVFGMMLGTGIGGGIVYRKKLLRGANGMAGSVDHTIISSSPRRCRLGHAGDVEVLCSGSGIERAYFDITHRKLLATDVMQAGRAGKKPAVQIYAEAVAGLATTFINISKLISPDVIVVGGGLLRYQTYLIDAIKRADSLAQKKHINKLVRITKIGDHATMIGAILAGNAKYHRK